MLTPKSEPEPEQHHGSALTSSKMAWLRLDNTFYVHAKI
jgi:hypothetical protein